MAEELAEWLARNGGCLNPDLNFFYALPGGDRGVVARKDIDKDTVLVYVPLCLCLHMPTEEEWESEADPQDQAASFLRKLSEPLSAFLATVLLLMHEISKGAQSKYAPFLSLLPAGHDCTLCWTDEEMAELAGTSIADTGAAKTAHEFDSLVRPVLEQRLDLWPPASCGYDAFVHAAGMVQSRAFHMKKENWITGENEDGEELYLIPGIDMINHSSRPQERNTALEQSSDGVIFRRKPDLPPEEYNGGLFVMKAGRKVAAGEQILHTYGDLSDAQLLQTYGFVEDPARPNRHNRNVRLPTIDLQKGIRALRRHHKPDVDRDDSWINIEEVEERLLVGKQRHDDLFKLAAYYVTGKAECLIMLSLVDKQLDGRLAAPNRHIKAAAATGRLRMAAVVREAEEKALRGLKNQLFQLLMAAPYNADDATAMDGEDCLGDLQWEPPEEELYPESSGDSEDEDGSEEDLEGSDEDSEDPEEEEEEEEEAENLNGVEASSFRDQAPETAGGKELAGGGADAPSADESALLSASVLPATEKRGRRSSTVSLRIGDPVRKRLKF